jgi:hypothetical protein
MLAFYSCFIQFFKVNQSTHLEKKAQLSFKINQSENLFSFNSSKPHQSTTTMHRRTVSDSALDELANNLEQDPNAGMGCILS